MRVPATFELYREELEAELRSTIGTDTLPLYRMMRYHLGWVDMQDRPQPKRGGKFVRCALCLVSCKAVGGDPHLAIPAAAAVELLHNFSLIHDDIEDVSSSRRHQPTVWKLWGQAQAINVGDAMHALAQLALFRLKERGVPEKNILRTIEVLDRTCVQLCEGQYMDISYESQLNISVQDYMNMISRKTAALMGSSTYLGALLGTEDEVVIGHLGRFGHKLGLLYQIRDDILGIWGREENTGKPSYTDIHQRKKTLPIIYGLEKTDKEEKKQLERIFQQETITPVDISVVVDILDSVNARSHAHEMVEHYCQHAILELRATELDSQARTELEELAGSLLD